MRLTRPRPRPSGALLASAALRFVTLAVLWLSLTGGDLGTLWLGVLGVAAATLASLVLLPPVELSWSLAGLAAFVVFFLRQSLVAGVDVALRAFRPDPNLDPALFEYELRLPREAEAARVLLANTISLLPGTLSAGLEGRRLLIHTLADGPGLQDELRQTEDVIARAFGIGLAEPAAPSTEAGRA